MKKSINVNFRFLYVKKIHSTSINSKKGLLVIKLILIVLNKTIIFEICSFYL